MPTFTVTLEETGERFRCPDTRTVLEGMACLGHTGIPVGCRGGGCGVCKVQVRAGTFVASVMSTDHVSAEDLAQGRVLACRVRPTSDLTLSVLGSMRKQLVAVPTQKETHPWR
jgi:ferredoxin